MKKLKYVLLGALISAVVSTCIAIPTLSWLSAKSDEVTNYFAGGKISVSMDEAKVDGDGKAIKGEDAVRVQNNTYKFVAGTTVDKDPTATVKKGSIPAYVFVVVENDYPDVFTYTVPAQWKVAGEAKDTNNKVTKTLYAYYKVVNAEAADVKLEPMFTTVTVSKDLTSEQLEKMDKVTADGEQVIKSQTFAIQSQVIGVNEAVKQAGAQFGFDEADLKVVTIQP